MKKTFIAMTVAALSFNIYAFDPAAAVSLSAPVKDYTKTTYTITEKFGEYYRSPKAIYLHVFDANGRQTETSEFTAKGAVVDRLVFAYDAAGNLTSTTGFDSDGKNSVLRLRGRFKAICFQPRQNFLSHKGSQRSANAG